MISEFVKPAKIEKHRNVFFSHPFTGSLYIDEIFVYYGRPEVFTCKNMFGHIYLFTHSESYESKEVWLGNLISFARLALLKSRKISLLSAIVEPEDESQRLVKLVEIFDPQEYIFNFLSVRNVDPELLPEPDYYIEANIDELPPSIGLSAEKSNSERRDSMFVSLANRRHVKEINTLALGNFLKDFQNATTALGYRPDSIQGRIPDKIKLETTLEATGAAAASFGIYLKSSELADLTGATKVSESLLSLFDVLSSSLDLDSIRRIMKNLNPRAIAPVVRIFKMLKQNELSLSCDLATANRKIRSVKIDYLTLEQRIFCLCKNIEETVERKTITGMLTGIDQEDKQFTLLPDGEKLSISGKVEFEISDPMTIMVRYKVTIDVRLKINELTGIEKAEYLLIDAMEID